jgi:post-segregation antitoxin (ccd killing protein)
MSTAGHEVVKKAEQERRWLEENRQALQAYNVRVARHGLLSDLAGILTPSLPPKA